VLAQNAPSDATADTATPTDIVVTGTRLASGFSAPTPVAVIGASRLEERGTPNVADALNEVPAFRASNTPASGELTPSAGYVGGRILDLRGLGAVRTLSLVDGKRFVPSSTHATVDTNMIPSILLRRAEVVTGGASAQYGSDAVAGVVNLILDDNLTGLRANLQHSITKYGDNSDTTAGLAGGFQLTDTLHFVFGGEYEDAQGTGGCQVRAFCRTEVLNFGRNPGDLSLPALNILPNIHPQSAPYNGVTVPIGYAGHNPILGPVSGITFANDGTPRRFQYGSLVNSLYQVGGEGTGQNIYFKDLLLVAPTERYAVTGKLKWAVTPDINASLMVNYGHLRGEYNATTYYNTGITIQADNPFIPRSSDPTLDIPTLLAANNLTSFKFGKGFNELGPVPIVTRNNMFRTVVSLDGKLGGSWSWDAYYQYGRNSFRDETHNNTVTARMLLALDAVRDGAGNIVCRSGAPGCVPFNPFGAQASPAARA
jgi:outer membrane receptor protein involved in Fe transport